MANLAARIALATSVLAFLTGPTAASAQEELLPTTTDVGEALVSAEYQQCRSSNEGRLIAQSHCSTDREFPTSISFEQILCVAYGTDIERNPIARCVFRGQQRIYPNPLGYLLAEQRDGRIIATPQESYPPRAYGDGAIDLIYNAGNWHLYID